MNQPTNLPHQPNVPEYQKMKRLLELRETLRIQNAGKHYLQCRDEADCVEEICAAIDAARSADKGKENEK